MSDQRPSKGWPALSLLAAMVAVAASWIIWVRPDCGQVTQARVLLGGVAWRVPAALQPEFGSEVGGPNFPTRYDSKRGKLYCRSASLPPLRQRELYFSENELKHLASDERYRAIAQFDLLGLSGGPQPRFAPASLGGSNEALHGPLLFGRPTFVSVQQIVTGSGRIVFIHRLTGWTPDGVIVSLGYTDAKDRDISASLRSVEALLSDLRDRSRDKGQ